MRAATDHRCKRDVDKPKQDNDKKGNKVQEDKNSKNKETDNTTVEKDVEEEYQPPQVEHSPLVEEQAKPQKVVNEVVEIL